MTTTLPYRWCPYGGARHVIWGQAAAPDAPPQTLCHILVPSPRTDSEAWLWPTCRECDVRVHARLGIPLPPPHGQEAAR